MIRTCSWCGEVMGTTLEGEGITHGMCEACLKKVDAHVADALNRRHEREAVIASYAEQRKEVDDE